MPARSAHDAPHEVSGCASRGAAPAHKNRKRDASVVLTARDRAAYIGGSRCAVRLGCYCAPAKLLTDTRLIRGPGVRFRSEARNFGGSPDFGRTGPAGPGCLTSESEERETWTAESLRAVGLRGETLSRRRPDETSAVHVSGQHPLFVRAIARMTTGGTSSNVSDQPGKVLIQLESLILAQSERWRQA